MFNLFIFGKFIVKYLKLKYNKKILFIKEIFRKGGVVYFMNGYLLIWILLQKIEKLEEELNTYKQQKADKN